LLLKRRGFLWSMSMYWHILLTVCVCFVFDCQINSNSIIEEKASPVKLGLCIHAYLTGEASSRGTYNFQNITLFCLDHTLFLDVCKNIQAHTCMYGHFHTFVCLYEVFASDWMADENISVKWLHFWINFSFVYKSV
jgi:hypothetical protein